MYHIHPVNLVIVSHPFLKTKFHKVRDLDFVKEKIIKMVRKTFYSRLLQ